LSICLEFFFDMEFLQKYLHPALTYLQTLRNEKGPKRIKKKAKEKSRQVGAGGWVWDLANTRGGASIFFAGPSGRCWMCRVRRPPRPLPPTPPTAVVAIGAPESQRNPRIHCSLRVLRASSPSGQEEGQLAPTMSQQLTIVALGSL
jgi:hypothetical protein